MLWGVLEREAFHRWEVDLWGWEALEVVLGELEFGLVKVAVFLVGVVLAHRGVRCSSRRVIGFMIIIIIL